MDADMGSTKRVPNTTRPSGSASKVDERRAGGAPDAKHRAVEHGAEEYYRREGSPAESEDAGRALVGGDAEVPEEQDLPQPNS